MTSIRHLFSRSDVRAFIAILIVSAAVARWLFAPTEALDHTMRDAVLIAVAFYLGSSKGSADKAEQIERMGGRG